MVLFGTAVVMCSESAFRLTPGQSRIVLIIISSVMYGLFVAIPRFVDWRINKTMFYAFTNIAALKGFTKVKDFRSSEIYQELDFFREASSCTLIHRGCQGYELYAGEYETRDRLNHLWETFLFFRRTLPVSAPYSILLNFSSLFVETRNLADTGLSGEFRKSFSILPPDVSDDFSLLSPVVQRMLIERIREFPYRLQPVEDFSSYVRISGRGLLVKGERIRKRDELEEAMEWGMKLADNLFAGVREDTQ